MKEVRTFVSDISGNTFPLTEKVQGESIRDSIMSLIQRSHPDFDRTKHISLGELNDYREQYISSYLLQEVGKLTELDQKVLDSISDQQLITDMGDTEANLTAGQRIADKVALFGGSWKFIIIFLVFIILWMTANVFLLMNKGFDPYPFILLNLILSSLAAFQAPIIMMSQNRQSEKDRQRSQNDYMINLKSELEVRGLHEKLDHLMLHQQQELIEIQRVQIEMQTDILRQLNHKMQLDSKAHSNSKAHKDRENR